MLTVNKLSCIWGYIRRSVGHLDNLSYHPPQLSTGVATHTWVCPSVQLPILEKQGGMEECPVEVCQDGVWDLVNMTCVR